MPAMLLQLSRMPSHATCGALQPRMNRFETESTPTIGKFVANNKNTCVDIGCHGEELCRRPARMSTPKSSANGKQLTHKRAAIICKSWSSEQIIPKLSTCNLKEIDGSEHNQHHENMRMSMDNKNNYTMLTPTTVQMEVIGKE